MSTHVVNQVIKLMLKASIDLKKSKILILGFSFKENCPDVRNTKVHDIYLNIKDFVHKVDVYDRM